MAKYTNKLLIFGFIVIVGLLLGTSLMNIRLQLQHTPQTHLAPTRSVVRGDQISYRGEAGVDALTLLKEKATVRQDHSGLVTSINGRAAIPAKKEYWAFYVNGKLASVGPADYQTKDNDQIVWKIAQY